MALATRCPHCQTTFRVANDQLKLRAGLVRCGSCREVFNGIEHLVRPDHSAPTEIPISLTAKDHSDPSQTTPAFQASTAFPDRTTFSAPAPIAPEIVLTKTSSTAIANSKWFGPLERRPVYLPDSAQPPSSTSEYLSSALSSTLYSPPTKPLVFTEGVEGHPFEPTFAPSSDQDVKPTEVEAPGEATPQVGVDVQHTTSATSSIKLPDVWHRLQTNEPDLSGINSPVDEEDPLQRMTLFQVASGNSPHAENVFLPDGTDTAEDEELDRLIDELQNRHWNGKKKNPPEPTIESGVDVTFKGRSNETSQENPRQADQGMHDVLAEPRFMQQAKRKQRVGGVVRTFMWIASVILTVGLIGQTGYRYRDQLAASVPMLKPLLQSACGKFGCQINLPTSIDDISIESNELQLIAPARNLFALTLLMRNRSSTAQAWPTVELTLNDASEKAIARRVFAPSDYLTTVADTADGFRRNTEHPVKLTFELLQLKPSGYRVYLFYP